MLKKTTIQYLLGLGMALMMTPIVEGTLAFLPDIGWHYMAVICVIIFVLQITFYYLTTNFKFGWSILSFVLNFILWTFEQVIVEKYFSQLIPISARELENRHLHSWRSTLGDK